MVMSTPQIELSDRIHKMEEQIPAIEKYHEFVEYHKAYKKLIELFLDGHEAEHRIAEPTSA